MRLGFISPSFRMLKMNWDSDYEMVKLGVPTLMAWLVRAGDRDCEHWDFDAQVCEAFEETPALYDLRQYFDTAKVKAFLDGSDDSLRGQTERLLDLFEITEKDIFGISLSAVLDRITNVRALAAVGQCMAKVLKERYPKAKIVFGGLQVSPSDLHEDYYREFMAECPAIDAALIGRTTAHAVQFLRNVARGELKKNASLDWTLSRSVDASGASVIVRGTQAITNDNLDPDVRALVDDVVIKAHHPAHTQKGAAAQAASAIESATALAGKSILLGNAFSSLRSSSAVLAGGDGPMPSAVAYEATHREDGSEIPASITGDHAYETIPAHVPWFDPKLVDRFRYSGQQIMKKFRFNKEHMLRFSRFENDRIVVLPHIFVRGCNAPCGFCCYAYTKIEGEDIIRTVEGLKWLSETYGCKHFHFLNTQINSVYNYAEAFCDAVVAAKLDILWSDCANMRSLDEKLLEKMRKSGAMRLVFGVESPEDEMLRYIHKGVTVEKIERLMKASHDLGIWNHVLLIAGMPHETPAKQDRMMDFLTRTAPIIDYYSVSSFYLIASSPWGKEPERFGIDRTSSPNELLESQAFNEIADGRWPSDGLRWPEKKQQIIDSTKRFYTTIAAAKKQTRCSGGNIDLYLLMFLYSALGHDRKAEIVKLYEETALEGPMDTMPAGVEQQPRQNGEAPVIPGEFRVGVPIVMGRVNEGDQSSLVHVPVTFTVSRRADNLPHTFATPRYTVAWRTPKLLARNEELTHSAMAQLRNELPAIVNRMGTKLLAPFCTQLEARLSPPTPERMAELIADNLPRWKAFSNEGFTVTGSGQRSVMDRNLEWSGSIDGAPRTSH